MKNIIDALFELMAVGFDKIPILKRFSGYRSVIGLFGLGLVKLLAMNGMIGGDLASQVSMGLMIFTGLSLNSKGR